jgi:ribonuclease HI
MGLDITFALQTTIKSQALVNFMAEWTEAQQLPAKVIREYWSMYFDDSFILNGAEGGFVLMSPKGDRFLYVIRLYFHATNDVAEYEVLIIGLYIATKLGVQWLYIHDDSKLIVNQVMGESNYHDSCMAAYRQEVRKLEEKFDGFELHHILRWDNEAADALAQLGSSREQPPLGVFVQDLIKPSIQLKKDSQHLCQGPHWVKVA